MDIDRPRLPQIAGYKTESVLGAGGMATVYLAIQESLSRHVALKVMNQVLMVDEDFRRRFLNEGRLIAKLSHPNIVTVYDIGVSDPFHYLSMTYLPGGTLREKIQGGLPVKSAIYILKCLADALGYAHSQGIVHRDIKPGNVLFTQGGAPVLTDFGIAKTVGNETKLTSTGMTVGSVGYMSPEQAMGNEVDNRSDLYSLGVLFWQMLTGVLPYSAQDPFALALKHANDPIPKLPRRLDRFQCVIEGLMAKRPDDRLASADALVRLVDRIPLDAIDTETEAASEKTVVLARAASRAPVPGSVPGEVGSGSMPRRNRALIPALVGATAIVAIAAFLGMRLLQTKTTPSPMPTSADRSRTTSVAGAVVPAAGRGQEPSHPPQGRAVGGAEVPAGQAAGDSGSAPASGPVAQPTSKAPGEKAGASHEIETLLRRAEQQWKAGHLTDPPGDNAFESYSRVLQLDPEHKQAEAALVELGRINAANRVFASADAMLRSGRVDDARRLIETGLMINPDDERLLGLKRALDYSH